MSRVIGPLSQTPSKESGGLAVGEGDKVGTDVGGGEAVGVAGVERARVGDGDGEEAGAVVGVDC
jgi:hypothetical protein